MHYLVPSIRKCFALAAAAALTLHFFALPAVCLTVDEAIGLSKENLPSYKASKIRIHSSRALYDASLSPYLPSLDASTGQEHHSAPHPYGDYDLSSYEVVLSYTLFDGGKRKANRSIAGQNLAIDKDELEKKLLELRFDVKTAFYTTLARKEILEERKVQLQDSTKDHEVAQGRNRLGAAKLSDVLQASVRLEQARFNLVRAEGELAKALSDLNSLTGRPLDTAYDLDGSLEQRPAVPDLATLSETALEKRPEIKQAKSGVAISKANKALEVSAFFPVISANGAYNRTDTEKLLGIPNDDSSIALTATWNIFELGKFYKTRSSEFQIDVSKERLNETIRQLLLELRKAYEDFLTASRNVDVAAEQLHQARYNYSQAFGEYKVGKGDILSLVQAESLLSVAREQFTLSKLNLVLSEALLERATGIERLGSGKGPDEASR